jgi:hypothetical protein
MEVNGKGLVQKSANKELAAKRAKRGDLGIALSNKNSFDSWQIGDNYKLEKILG